MHRATHLRRLFIFAAFSFAGPGVAHAQGPVLVVQPSAIVQTIAGTGTEGYSGDSGSATSAKIASPTDRLRRRGKFVFRGPR
jgi:hypothetical protein